MHTEVAAVSPAKHTYPRNSTYLQWCIGQPFVSLVHAPRNQRITLSTNTTTVNHKKLCHTLNPVYVLFNKTYLETPPEYDITVGYWETLK